MKLTNRLNLPSSIVRAVSRDPYSRGDAHISVTGLIAKRFAAGCAVSHIDGRHGRYVGTKAEGGTVFILVAHDGGGEVEAELPGYWSRVIL